jgi:hypothetical protein
VVINTHGTHLSFKATMQAPTLAGDFLAAAFLAGAAFLAARTVSRSATIFVGCWGGRLGDKMED